MKIYKIIGTELLELSVKLEPLTESENVIAELSQCFHHVKGGITVKLISDQGAIFTLKPKE
jgi:hypothetical protein